MTVQRLVKEKIVADLPVKEWPVIIEGDLAVMVDTSITQELAAEGMAREIVHRLQMMRRSAGFDITDHIITYYQTKEPLIKQVMNTFAIYIEQETLSKELIDGLPPDGAYSEKHRISNSEVSLAIKKVNPTS